MTSRRFFHGGVPGLYPGNEILPATTTGAISTAAHGNKLCDPSRVYVTEDLRIASIMAGTWRARGGRPGDVYEVESYGELEPDPDARDGGSWSCERALILRVVPVREWHPRTWAALAGAPAASV